MRNGLVYVDVGVAEDDENNQHQLVVGPQPPLLKNNR